ncbi:MAG: hypothetical protein ACQGVC_24405 [Myxococcota bacterium]
MSHRSASFVALLALVAGLLAAAPALASVKCQCNNGTLAHAMGADWDDDDVEEACNDACSESGGGRVWSVDEDDDYSDSDDGHRHHRKPASPRR